jgi:hypothetical protein
MFDPNIFWKTRQIPKGFEDQCREFGKFGKFSKFFAIQEYRVGGLLI